MLVLIVMFWSAYITVGYKVQKTILTSEQLRNWLFIITLVKGAGKGLPKPGKV
jgi:hypothetical protein